MPLDLDQLRSLAQLKRAVMNAAEAQADLERLERHCWEMGISGRQICIVMGESHSKVYRRRLAAARGVPR